jgi:hypothetical protein
VPNKWFFLFKVFYCVNIIPVKLSIGSMLIRIAKVRSIFRHSARPCFPTFDYALGIGYQQAMIAAKEHRRNR